MIEFQHVFKSYGRGRNILADINFRVSAESSFRVRPSGAGKSTLLADRRAGARQPRLHPGQRATAGQAAGPRAPYLRRAVGVILQDTHLLFDRSAFENVMLPLAVTGQAWDSAIARARRWTRSACRARKN